MDFPTAAVYGVAAVLAVQGLFALMIAHRRQSLRRFFEQEIRRREQEAAQQPAAQPAPPVPQTTRTKAA